MNVHSGFDYVVVGAGSAGCALSYRLAESGARVALLEAGGSDRSLPLRVPAALQHMDRKFNWRYEAEPDASRNGMVEYWAGGRVIGGSSSINGMVFVRGNAADYDQWEAAGCPGWGYEEVLPYFKRLESYELGGDPRYRGRTGPQHVSRMRVNHVLTDAFIEAAQQAGHPYNDDYNGQRQLGVARGQLTQKDGLRHSVARAYLDRARRMKNFTLIKDAFVRRVRFSGDRCTGVEYTVAGTTHTIDARREVVLCAGAIASPKLLMVSGVGPAETLERFGVDVVHDASQVGRNLQEHLYCTMQYAVTERTLNRYFTPRRMFDAAVDFVMHRRGPLTAAFAHVVLFGSNGTEYPVDYQTFMAPLGVTSESGDTDWQHTGAAHDVNDIKLMKIPAVTILPSIVHSKARGEISIRSSNPEDPPVIRHEMLSNADDVAMLLVAARNVRDIMSSPAIKGYVRHEVLPGDNVQTDEEWLEYLRVHAFRGEHPIGTCRMGSDTDAVVDPRLRVQGVEGLRVADASIMPNLPSGNTNAPTIMIGEKGADLILTGP